MLVAGGLLWQVGWAELAFGLIAIILVRPLCGWLALIGSDVTLRERAVISIYGIRGIGSVYYLAYGLGHGGFEGAHSAWSALALIILLSVLLHGATASPVMNRLDRVTGREVSRGPAGFALRSRLSAAARRSGSAAPTAAAPAASAARRAWHSR